MEAIAYVLILLIHSIPLWLVLGILLGLIMVFAEKKN
jgi:hypothetical protein